MGKLLTFVRKHVDMLLLAAIVLFAIWLRLATANIDIILDYDPWFWFRHAQEILKNNFVPPKWDLLSYFPGGRPFNYQLGWSYTLAAGYVLVKVILTNLTFMKFSIYFIAIFSGLCAIPAYFVGKMITNKWGGLITAFFAVITPTFLGVSMAGYPDSDTVDVLYTFLVVLATLYAIKNYHGLKSKKTWFSIALAVVSYWLFALNWNTSWYILYIFIGFVPIFIIFKIIEALIQKQKIVTFVKESEHLVLVIALIGILGEILTLLTWGWPFNTIPPIQQLFNGLSFISGRSLLVNISVAELQTLNILSKNGILAIVSRVGPFPILLAILSFPLVGYKLLYKKKITVAEYFAIIWMIISFWLITRGIRFSLLFSMAVATSAGFVVGSLVEFTKQKKELLFLSVVYGIILFGLFWHASDNISFSYQAGGMEVGQNWRSALDWLKANSDKNTLITTWWDPGHIIAGYAGLQVMADGAHCPSADCVPYDHNVRIQDMGYAFSTSNETESLAVLQKYMGLTSQQCQEVKQKYGNAVPDEACSKVSQMYVIASADLIGKYYWLSYFGNCLGKNGAKAGQSCYYLSEDQFKSLADQNKQYIRNFLPMQYSGKDSDGNLVYGGILTLAEKNNQLVPIINVPQQGIINAVVKQIVFYQNGQEVRFDYSNTSKPIDGLVWVDPSGQTAIFMDASIRDSVFYKLFFGGGEGLAHFEPVYTPSVSQCTDVGFVLFWRCVNIYRVKF